MVTTKVNALHLDGLGSVRAVTDGAGAEAERKIYRPFGDAFAESLEAPHLRLDPASDMASGPAFPERPTVAEGGAQGCVSGDRGRAVLFPRPPVLADRDDRRSLAADDGVVTAAGVAGAVGGHCADPLTLGDLVEQFRQDRAVTIAAGGKHHRPDVRGCRVRGQMHLAPLTTALATIPVVCLSGNLNGTLMVRQNRIAQSENTAERPGLPSCGASQVISLSSQTGSNPRLRREAV